jgi:hypothetical protein
MARVSLALRRYSMNLARQSLDLWNSSRNGGWFVLLYRPPQVLYFLLLQELKAPLLASDSSGSAEGIGRGRIFAEDWWRLLDSEFEEQSGRDEEEKRGTNRVEKMPRASCSWLFGGGFHASPFR